MTGLPGKNLCAMMLILVSTSVLCGNIWCEEWWELVDWIPATDPRIEINGLPFFAENGGDYYRMPKSAQGVLPAGVWAWAKCPSGGRVRFHTNSGYICVRMNYPIPPVSLINMHVYGKAGVDCYLDGDYLMTGASSTSPLQHIYSFSMRKDVDVTFYLPLYAECKDVEIGIYPGSSISAPARFRLEKPVVFYGTSITQGGCVSHPGNTYAAITCRSLNLDFVNFGFDGSGKGETSVAQQIAEVDAACYVLHYGQNSSPVPGAGIPPGTSLQEVYIPFIQALRATRPSTPIVCVTPVYNTFDFPLAYTSYEPWREVVRTAVQTLQDEGDTNLHLVEGFSLLGPQNADGLTDGLHPNDAGTQAIAGNLARELAMILKLKQGSYWSAR